MSSTKSHKKKKRTAVNIKQENADLAKKCRIANKKPTSSSPASYLTNEIVPSPSRRRRIDSYYKIGNDRLNLSFRSQSHNYTNMMAQMSEKIDGNFNLKYKRRSTPNRRSGRNTSPIPLHDNQSISLLSDFEPVAADNFTLSNHLRCYVEDFMTLGVGSSIIVLVPRSELKVENSIWKELLSSDVNFSPIQLTKNSYLGYNGIINTNPMLSNVKNGMHVSDFESGFNNHNYGCNVKFDSESISISVLITWSIVLLGKTTGVQVWRSGDGYRDVYSNFADRSKTTQGLTTLLNVLYASYLISTSRLVPMLHLVYTAKV